MRQLLTAIATTTVLGGSLVGASAVQATTVHDTARAARPATEQVTYAVHRVHLLYSSQTSTPGTSQGHGTAATVHGAKATQLIDLFNALKREPRGTIHCEIAGGPQTTVTFYGPHHTWRATQGACTNLEVMRDGKSLPTLLPSKAWTAAVNNDLGR